METLTAQDLRPTNSELREAALKALQGRVSEDEVRKFLEKANGEGSPPAIGAEGSVNLLVWGKCKCYPDGMPWQYDNTIWGGPAYSGNGVGFMYTAYNTWEAFFNNVTGCHAQGIATAGGVLQINWFNASGLPVGQFNGAVGGIGVFEAGGEGKWQRK